ncbi:MAG: sel1 repeat family protein [Lysobacteraceae bacterium]|nr:MAG: sel1 repeat family protein [Xanthomonadaceae bacterium]
MKLRLIALAASLLGLPALAASQEAQQPHKAELQAPVERPSQGSFVGEPGISPHLMTEGFLSGHPDLRWRREGQHAYANKRYDEAMTYFLRAARYADKPSQAMIAEMYWKGIGVAQDRMLGYAWMDLAAERFYSNFVIKREEYWRALGEIEQREAIVRGQPLLAEYGDDVAKARMAKVLRKERSATGSRVGFVGNLEIIPFTRPNAGSGMTIRGDEYYAPKYWQADKYFEWQDQVWDAPSARKGRVEVGDVEQAGKPGRKTEP